MAGAALAGGALVRPTMAIEPIVRPGKPDFKFSLAAYSYRDLLSGKNASLTLADFIDDCAKMGLEGTELTSYYFPPNPTPEYLCGLKRQAFLLGLDISGTAVGNDFCHPPGAERDRQIASVKQWADRAEVLGAPVIRIFSGQAKKGQDEAEARRLAIEAMEECCEYAGQHGVFLALENHGGLTATLDGLLQLVHAVKSEWFGVNLDTGNFNTADPYADLARLAPYAVNVQV
ncbi:MAG: sugar phosphate isomerase/epimerase family protein, partial [Candidatus Saccharimonadales bacterium]